MLNTLEETMAEHHEVLRTIVEDLRRTVANQAREIRRLRDELRTLTAENAALGERIAEYGRVNRESAGTIVRLRRELGVVRARLQLAEEKANVDALTKAFRLDAFARRLQESILHPEMLPAHMCPEGKGSVLLFVDLIDFKEANERFGHAQANDILRHLVRVLFDKGTIRLYDTACIGEDDKTDPRMSREVGRFGGDEFLIYCGEVTEDEARKIATRVKRKCESEPITLTDVASGQRVEYAPRLHVAAVWWPRTSVTLCAEALIETGGILIADAKRGRHDPDHISWRALAEN